MDRSIVRVVLERRAIVAAGVALLMFHLSGSAPGSDPNAQPIRLTIDYGDGVQKAFTALPWKEKMTVFDALAAAGQHPRGIKLAYTGSGETLFITAIDDAVNEGQGGRNWRYTVNDQPARYGAGVSELKAGDAVLWRFSN